MSDAAVKPDGVEDAPPPADPPAEETKPAADLVRVTGVEPPEAMLWRHFGKLGKMLADSAFVPSSFRVKVRDENNLLVEIVKPAEVMATIAYGHEIGLGPMQSLQSFDVIKGKPTLKPETMRALIRSAGHSLVRLEATSEKVTFRGKRRDTGDEETVTYTIEDAKALGLTSKDNWKQQPRAMLTARCTGEIARSLFSDVIAGASYTPEEMDDDRPATEHEEAIYYAQTGQHELHGGGPIPMDEPRQPPVRIVQSDPQHAGRAVRADKPAAFNWHWVITGEAPNRVSTATCNACAHPVERHGGLGASGGCSLCACKVTEWTDPKMELVEGSGSPADQSGVTAPAAVAVNDGCNPVEGADPTPPDNDDARRLRVQRMVADKVTDEMLTTPIGDLSAADQAILHAAFSGAFAEEMMQRLAALKAADTEHTPPAGVDATDPPPKETPHSDGGGSGPIPNLRTESQFRAIHSSMRDLKLDDDDRHVVIAFVTGKRTESSKDITGDEATIVLNLLNQIRTGALSVGPHDGARGIFTANDRGVKFLKSIERKITPTGNQTGSRPASEGNVESLPDDDDGSF